MKKIILAIVLIGLIALSCEKFLKEEMVSGIGYSYYNSEQGISDGVNACYPYLKELWGSYRGMNLLELGTDEMINGFGGERYTNYYSSDFNSSVAFVNDLWTQMYAGINCCNSILESISNVTFTDISLKEIKLGEAYFLRAIYYFVLVRQFGAVPLKLNVTTSPER